VQLAETPIQYGYFYAGISGWLGENSGLQALIRACLRPAMRDFLTE
jgi:hypothetical protein